VGVTRTDATKLGEVDDACLLVVGGPTHMRRMSSPRTADNATGRPQKLRQGSRRNHSMTTSPHHHHSHAASRARLPGARSPPLPSITCSTAAELRRAAGD
jgi:hypothetical protein